MSNQLKRLRVAALGACFTALLVAPQMASAGLAEDVIGGVQNTVDQTTNTVGGLLGGGGGAPTGGSTVPAPAPAPAPLAPAPTPLDATTEPELDGTNPHGQGTVIDTTVENPLGAPIGVEVGGSRGEQEANGDYHGVITILSVTDLPLIGDLTIEEETGEGETVESPVSAVNDLLDDVCAAGNVCLGLLEFRSETDGKGSKNSFQTASVDVLDDTVGADVVSSDGNIRENDRCQRADGSSTAANVGVVQGAVSADALESSSESKACRGEAPTAEGDSQVLDLGALDALDPLALVGCDSTAVDDEFSVPILIEGVCNGDDTNGSQADAPYNTRTALQLDVLESLLNPLGIDLDLDASDSESLARAPDAPEPPEEPECPDPDNPVCDDDPPNDPPNDPDDPDGPDGPGPGDPDGPSADTPDGLPFTGADMGMLGLIGALVMGSGLGLMALADRRRRALQD